MVVGIRLTQIELADKIGISKSQYIRYETKDVQPPANILNKLSDTVGTSVDFLISGDKSEKAKASLKIRNLFNALKKYIPYPKKNKASL